MSNMVVGLQIVKVPSRSRQSRQSARNGLAKYTNALGINNPLRMVIRLRLSRYESTLRNMFNLADLYHSLNQRRRRVWNTLIQRVHLYGTFSLSSLSE